MNTKIYTAKQLLDMEIEKFKNTSPYMRLKAVLKIEEYFSETYGFQVKFKLMEDGNSYLVTFLDFNFDFEIYETNPDKIIPIIEQIMRDKLENKELIYVRYFNNGNL